MGCKHSNFWIGVGIGSVLGALAYRFSRTARAKKLQSDVYDAICQIGKDAERKALQIGSKAMEVGAKMADKVAVGAEKVSEKTTKLASEVATEVDRAASKVAGEAEKIAAKAKK